MAVAVTNSTITTFNTAVLFVNNPATSTVVDATEVFTITPTKSDEKVVVEIINGTGHGALEYSIAAGTYWAGGAALTGEVAAGTKRLFVLEGAKYKAQAGTVAVTLTPAAGKRLLTDHASAVNAVQLP